MSSSDNSDSYSDMTYSFDSCSDTETSENSPRVLRKRKPKKQLDKKENKKIKKIDNKSKKVYKDEDAKEDEDGLNLFQQLIKNMVIKRLNEDLIEEEVTKNEKKKMIEEVKEMESQLDTNTDTFDILKYKHHILKLDDKYLNINSKKFIINQINSFQRLSPRDSDYYKLSEYITTLYKIPFGIYNNFTNLDTSQIISRTNDFYEKIDKSIYGQKDVKNKLVEIIHNSFTNPNTTTQVIGLCGPPGIGKTTLIKNGLSKALQRPFFMYSLGGAKDGSDLNGHHFTYIGATYGFIVKCLHIGGTMSPIIFFDELCKVSESSTGKEIIGILTHLIDETQNNDFQDKYFQGISFDLSKAIFIFSYNQSEKIDYILKDRIVEIKMEGYSIPDKINIIKKYIIPECSESIGINTGDVIFDDIVLNYIINNYTDIKNKGIRNIKEIIKQIYLKINLIRFTGIEQNILGNLSKINISFPYKITKKDIDIILSHQKTRNHLDHLTLMYL